MGAGAGIALEDAMVLHTLFSTVSSREDITAAFEAYDMVRRPRCQQVVDMSRETGQIFCGEFGLDVAELRAKITPRFNFILGQDMAAHNQDALRNFARIKRRQNGVLGE
jgi:salicylate hydroxylase